MQYYLTAKKWSSSVGSRELKSLQVMLLSVKSKLQAIGPHFTTYVVNQGPSNFPIGVYMNT